MTRYHLNENGEPTLCKATKRPCPLGAAPHHDFESKADAYEWAEQRNELESLGLGHLDDFEAEVYRDMEENLEYYIYDSDGVWDYQTGFGRDSVARWAKDNLQSILSDVLYSVNEEQKTLSRIRGVEVERYHPEESDMASAAWQGWAYDQIKNNPDTVSVWDLASNGGALGPFDGASGGGAGASERWIAQRRKQLFTKPLNDEARDTLLSREYNDSRYAEPSNILRVLQDDKSYFIQNVKSLFPVDGDENSDSLTFTSEWEILLSPLNETLSMLISRTMMVSPITCRPAM